MIPARGSGWYREVGTQPPGPLNAITDVAGVEVGHATLIEGEGKRVAGVGPVRTGVTVVVPGRDIWTRPVRAGAERINGAGEVCGLEWMRESGELQTAIGLTNTHSLGVVRDALTRVHVRENPRQMFSLPVVGETCDVVLNDMYGHHVRTEHVEAALADAKGGPVEQGSVGSGTGMICHDFKGGIGSASRRVVGEDGEPEWTVGVLVQANHGMRERLTIDGVPVGRMLGVDKIPGADWASIPSVQAAAGTGSIIIVLATDAPLLAPECASLAKRATFGLARTGGAGERKSGDFAVAFSTAREEEDAGDPRLRVSPHLSELRLSALYWAAIEATEQAIVNALLAAETMTGADGNVVHALTVEHLDALPV
ncbi:MAG: P1 family peptidase [Actinobacteria bacterium]|nr:P1 family peptidase [Actinomycetota bacterium]